jgi:hypothetical protein
MIRVHPALQRLRHLPNSLKAEIRNTLTLQTLISSIQNIKIQFVLHRKHISAQLQRPNLLILFMEKKNCFLWEAIKKTHTSPWPECSVFLSRWYIQSHWASKGWSRMRLSEESLPQCDNPIYLYELCSNAMTSFCVTWPWEIWIRHYACFSWLSQWNREPDPVGHLTDPSILNRCYVKVLGLKHIQIPKHYLLFRFLDHQQAHKPSKA